MWGVSPRKAHFLPSQDPILESSDKGCAPPRDWGMLPGRAEGSSAVEENMGLGEDWVFSPGCGPAQSVTSSRLDLRASVPSSENQG